MSIPLRPRFGFVAGLLALSAVPMAAGAQNLDSLRRLYTIEYQMPTSTIVETAMRASPGSSSGSVSAYGAGWGDFFVGAGYQQRARYLDNHDGTVVAGFGIGSAAKWLGLEVAVTSVSTLRRGIGEAGTMSFKVHRLLPASIGAAVGVENAVDWGFNDGGQSYYGVLSQNTTLRRNTPTGFLGSAVFNLGVGTGRFRLERDFLADPDGVSLSPFGSIGLRVHERAAFITDWTGQDLALAVSIVPFRRFPLVITPAIADVTGHAGDGARFTLGAGAGFRINNLPTIFVPVR